MKKITLLLLLILLYQITQAQKNQLSIKPNYNYDSTDLYKLLEILDIEIVKFNLSKEFCNHSLNLVIDEFTNGKVKEVYNFKKELGSIFQYSTKIIDSTILEESEIRFYSRKYSDSLLKLNCTFINTDFRVKLHLKKKSYSFKDVYNLEKNKHPIVLNQKFPLVAYTQPVGQKFNIFKGESSEFCKINGEQNSYLEWYKKLGIEHYFIFSIVVEK